IFGVTVISAQKSLQNPGILGKSARQNKIDGPLVDPARPLGTLSTTDSSSVSRETGPDPNRCARRSHRPTHRLASRTESTPDISAKPVHIQYAIGAVQGLRPEVRRSRQGGFP